MLRAAATPRVGPNTRWKELKISPWGFNGDARSRQLPRYGQFSTETNDRHPMPPPLFCHLVSRVSSPEYKPTNDAWAAWLPPRNCHLSAPCSRFDALGNLACWACHIASSNPRTDDLHNDRLLLVHRKQPHHATFLHVYRELVTPMVKSARLEPPQVLTSERPSFSSSSDLDC